MTPQQQATLGEIAMWIGTAQQLLRQAKAATYTRDADSILPMVVHTAIADALGAIDIAAKELLPLVQTQEVQRG